MEKLYATAQRDGMQIQYFMTKEEGKEDKSFLFGIRAVKTQGEMVEEERTGAVTRQEDEILLLLDKLCRNAITPCVLNEVVDDIL